MSLAENHLQLGRNLRKGFFKILVQWVVLARTNNYKEPKLTVYEREAGRVYSVYSAHGSLFNKTNNDEGQATSIRCRTTKSSRAQS